ncbi:MAG: putative signal transducing protein [Longimicrobiales bacterium]
MPETRLAHFDHHWEAELAQGYLEDAGVPSRVASDNLAGGHTYMGSVSGASLLVAPEQLDEARGILVAAGVLEGDPGAADAAPGPPGYDRAAPPALRPLSHLQESDRRDLTERLEAARKAEVRHFIRCMLGVTPTAVIPIVGLALEGNVALLALLCVLVVLVEGWKWIRSGRLVRRLQGELARLEEGSEDGDEDDAEGAGAGA